MSDLTTNIIQNKEEEIQIQIDFNTNENQNEDENENDEEEEEEEKQNKNLTINENHIKIDDYQLKINELKTDNHYKEHKNHVHILSIKSKREVKDVIRLEEEISFELEKDSSFIKDDNEGCYKRKEYSKKDENEAEVKFSTKIVVFEYSEIEDNNEEEGYEKEKFKSNEKKGNTKKNKKRNEENWYDNDYSSNSVYSNSSYTGNGNNKNKKKNMKKKKKVVFLNIIYI